MSIARTGFGRALPAILGSLALLWLVAEFVLVVEAFGYSFWLPAQSAPSPEDYASAAPAIRAEFFRWELALGFGIPALGLGLSVAGKHRTGLIGYAVVGLVSIALFCFDQNVISS